MIELRWHYTARKAHDPYDGYYDRSTNVLQYRQQLADLPGGWTPWQDVPQTFDDNHKPNTRGAPYPVTDGRRSKGKDRALNKRRGTPCG